MYEEIKKAAKESKVSVRELLALSPKNDPFYVGSKGDIEKAKWIADIYRRMGSPAECHIRRMHYWAVVKAKIKKPDGTLYENTEEDWGYILVASKYARYLGLIPMEKIVDRRNPKPIIHTNYWPDEDPEEELGKIDAEKVADTIVEQFYCYNPANAQAYHLEVWEEKSTMLDKTDPVCTRLLVNHVPGLGELSITSVHDLIKRVVRAGKPVRVFYISDFDPAGEGMPISIARKIEWFIRSRYPALDVKLTPLVLTKEQCDHYELPRTPIKASDKRKRGFEERHGGGATELDALEAIHPGELARILEEALSPYFDAEAHNAVVDANKAVRESVREAVMEHEDELRELLKELDIKFEEPDLRRAKLIEEAGDWLYDSKREYDEQLERYKEVKSEKVE